MYLAPEVEAEKIELDSIMAAQSLKADPTREGDASLSPSKESFDIWEE